MVIISIVTLITIFLNSLIETALHVGKSKKNTPIKTQPSLDAANLSRASSLAGPTWPQKNIG